MIVAVNLSSEVARWLEDKAAQHGLTIAAYLQQLAENDVSGSVGSALLPPDLSLEEFDRHLDELAAGPKLPHLPDGFSRADIYADHD
jgi:hypothetical protein